MNVYYLTHFVFLLGLTTVILSFIVSIKFIAISYRAQGTSRFLARAFSFQLISEFVMGLGTLTFTIGQLTGILSTWSIEFQSGIRIAMFLANALTTCHLLKTLKILQGD